MTRLQQGVDEFMSEATRKTANAANQQLPEMVLRKAIDLQYFRTLSMFVTFRQHA